MILEAREVRRAFSRAAGQYDQFAVLQAEVRARLAEQLSHFKFESSPNQAIRILDLGAGTGAAYSILQQSFPKAEIIAMDLALPMLQRARKQAGWFKRVPVLCADANQLPLADASIDLVFSNLCLQWCLDLPVVFDELRRVMKPGAGLLFSTFGPDTLHELRAAWRAADEAPHVNQFIDMHIVGDAMISAGFRDPVLDLDHFTLTYASAINLMSELKAIGAHNADVARTRGLTGKRAYSRMLEAYETHRRDGVLPATYEVIYAQARAPDANQPRRSRGGDVASFSIEQLRGSRIQR